MDHKSGRFYSTCFTQGVALAFAAGLGAASQAASLNSVGNVYHVSQITGQSANSATEHAWGLSGTDIGTMFKDFSGAVFLAFGDSYGYFNGLGAGGNDWRYNLLAKSIDTTPSNGLDFYDMVSDPPNRSKTIIPKDANDHTVIPNGGVSIGDRLYIHYQRILQWGPGPGQWSANGSGIATSVDHGQNWTKTSMWNGSSGFVQAALVRTGGYVYFFGIPAGRFGGVKLARVPEASILTLSAYRYWTGSTWSTSQTAAATIVPAPVGELSVAYNSFLGQYIMLYLNENTASIQIRASTSLTGPWSAPLNVVTGATYPGLYAPMLHPNFSSGQEIYFALSAWDPYNVYLVHTTLNPGATSWGPYDLPGRVEAENFREGGEGIGYHDTTAGNSGGAYRSGDVDLTWNSNEDAHQVGWIESGEWLSYKVNVLQAGAYKFRLKYGSVNGCTVQVDAPGGNPLYVPATALGGTGGFSTLHVWEPDTVFNLNAGQQYINLYFPVGGCDITWWEIYPAYSGATFRVNAGGAGYTDPAGKFWSGDGYFSGGLAGSSSVAIANTIEDVLYDSERYGNFSYNFPVANGSYKVRLRFAEYFWSSAGQRRFHVDLEGGRRLYDYDIIARAGGQNIAKDELLTVYVEDGTLNINFATGTADQPKVSAIEVVPAGAALYTWHRVPGHIEAEDFANGGEGFGYHDTTTGNTGGAYRGKDVDIRTKVGGGYQVGWVEAGEWLSYHINVAATGTYRFRMRYSSGAGATVQVDAPGGSPVYVPATSIGATGGWDTFATWAPANTFTLNAGSQFINLYFPAGSCDVDYLEIYQ